MMNAMFTPDQIAAMSAEIEAQLQELYRNSNAVSKEGTLRSGDTENLDQLFDKQFNTISSGTNQTAKAFLKNFSAAAKAELCGKDGTLYKKWQQWSDLESKDTLNAFGGVLIGMGFSGGVLQGVAIAVSVVVLRLGLAAFCKTFGEES